MVECGNVYMIPSIQERQVWELRTEGGGFLF